MVNWRTNLAVLWVGNFLVMGGMTMVMPFLPFYIQELGVSEHVGLWAGIIFAANFVSSFIFQPIWGKLADRFGRKIMLLRSGFGMAIVMTLMGFSGNVWHLLLLRFLNGTISGFAPASLSLVSANTPKDRMGFAMGLLQSGTVAGTIMGPLLGGLLAGWLGYRPLFYFTGILLFIASMCAMFLVKDTFDREEASKKPSVSVLAGYRELMQIRALPALYTVTLLIQFSLLSTMPLIPLYIQELYDNKELLAFFAGLVSTATGVSNMVFSPLLGRLSDAIGAKRILICSLIGAAVITVPQALAQNVWQLLAARFLLGMCMGGMIPTVNSLIRKFTPDGMEGRSFSFNSSFLSIGNVTGPVIGGLLGGLLGIRWVFLIAGVLLILNAIWVYTHIQQPAREEAAM